jgi:anthranilate synthase component 1
MVQKCKDHIIGGDISQVVVSQRFMVENTLEPFDVYRILRSTNPSPYLYYFDHKDYCIAGASPEMLVSVVDGKVCNRPIAGTYPRGKTAEQDEKFARLLSEDIKERSEHAMLVDLGRNDVGRVCRAGTVKVTDFMRVEKYSRLMHLVSDVEGELDEGKTAVDALMSVLPAGTLSGAPKVKAMEIIDELENVKRGVYGGTIGYMSLDGDIDSCIAIRTVLFKDGKAYVQAGAGIVYDSVPKSEYEETKRKASAVINALSGGAM